MNQASDQSLLLDDEIAALTLQLEEIGINQGNGKGKYPVGRQPDNEVAAGSFQAEILAHLTFLKDLQLAHSIARAVDTDAQAIAELAQPEEQAREDRLHAIRLGNETHEDASSTGFPIGYSSRNEQAFSNAGIQSIILDGSDDEPDDESQAGPSVAYANRQARAFDKFHDEHQCAVCFEEYRITSMFSLSCGDWYCVDCLKTLFLNATTDETLFPPRCCRQLIPLEYIQRELSINELRAFRDSEIEFSTHDRTYCSNLRCGKFIPPVDIAGDRAECPRCFDITCTACKAAFHEGNDCPADLALQATISLAHAQGWQRCYACRAMVELDYGCNHMTRVFPFPPHLYNSLTSNTVVNVVHNFATFVA